jgi:mannose-6-phosphate isomerase-like protein (cupin superfamily)
MRIRILLALLLAAAPAAAQPAVKSGWAPKPIAAPFVAPNRAVWRLADVLKAHRNQKSWSQVLARDAKGLTATYIQSAPGEVSLRVMYSDTTMFFVVQSGTLRVTIDGVEPFTATQGGLVQVPSLRFFQVETVGATPALRFEVTQTLAPPIYAEGQTPQPLAGRKFVRVGYYSPAASYDGKQPLIDYQRDIATGKMSGAGVVQDDFISANIQRSMPGGPAPASNNRHFHLSSAIALILEGEMDYQIEGERDFTASAGDVVYVPQGRWHRAAPGGSAMAAQISISPVASAISLMEPAR